MYAIRPSLCFQFKGFRSAVSFSPVFLMSSKRFFIASLHTQIPAVKSSLLSARFQLNSSLMGLKKQKMALRFSTLSIVKKDTEHLKQSAQETSESDAKFKAFSARIGVPLNDFQILQEALTHISYRPTSPGTEQENAGGARYNLMGKKVLDLFVSQYIMNKYPKLPAPVCTSIVQAYIGQSSLSAIGKSCGIQFVTRWKMSDNIDTNKEKNHNQSSLVGPPSVRCWAVESLIGVIYRTRGAEEAKMFIMKHILSRNVDAEEHYDTFIKLNRPRQTLAHLLKTLSKPPPVARLLKESGRQSHAPVFIVGIYSGFEKIGESYGSSLKMAENRAIRDALIRHFGAEVKNVQLPEVDLPEESFLRPADPNKNLEI